MIYQFKYALQKLPIFNFHMKTAGRLIYYSILFCLAAFAMDITQYYCIVLGRKTVFICQLCVPQVKRVNIYAEIKYRLIGKCKPYKEALKSITLTESTI